MAEKEKQKSENREERKTFLKGLVEKAFKGCKFKKD